MINRFWRVRMSGTGYPRHQMRHMRIFFAKRTHFLVLIERIDDLL
jgi:hypothetical protein